MGAPYKKRQYQRPLTPTEGWIVWLFALPAGVLLVLAGVGKILDGSSTMGMLETLGIPRWWWRAGLPLFAGFEIAVGLCILIGWVSRMLYITAIITWSFFVALTGVIWINGEERHCGCFGSLWLGASDGSDVGVAFVRNLAILAGLAISAIVYCRRQRRALAWRFSNAIMISIIAVGACAPHAYSQWDFVWDYNLEKPLETTIDDRFRREIFSKVAMDEEVRNKVEAILAAHETRFAEFKQKETGTVQDHRQAIESVDGADRWFASCKAYPVIRRIADEQRRLDLQTVSELREVLVEWNETAWLRFLVEHDPRQGLGRPALYPEEQISLIEVAEDVFAIAPDDRCPGSQLTTPTSEATSWVTEYLRSMVQRRDALDDAIIAIARDIHPNQKERTVVDDGEVLVGIGPLWVHEREKRSLDRMIRAHRSLRDLNRVTMRNLVSASDGMTARRLEVAYSEAIQRAVRTTWSQDPQVVRLWSDCLTAAQEQLTSEEDRLRLDEMMHDVPPKLLGWSISLADSIGIVSEERLIGSIRREEVAARTAAAVKVFSDRVNSLCLQVQTLLHALKTEDP